MLFSSNLMQRTAIHRQCMRLPSSPRESRKRNKGNKSNTTIQGAQRSPVSYMYSSVTLEADAFDLIRVFLFVQVSRSIGDAYLKRTEFNKEPLLSKFRLPKPFYEPILRPEPEISVHRIRPEDKFVIFASDGLWECLSNREAVNIVRSSPRRGIAKRLVEAALKEAAKRREIRHTDLLKIEQGVRRQFHDDITVVVVFIDSRSDNGDSPKNCSVSV